MLNEANQVYTLQMYIIMTLYIHLADLPLAFGLALGFWLSLALA